MARLLDLPGEMLQNILLTLPSYRDILHCAEVFINILMSLFNTDED